MSVDPKQALLNALLSKDQKAIEGALVNYLRIRPNIPSVSAALQENIGEICDLDTSRSGVSADKCIRLLSDCISGDKQKCFEALGDLTEDIGRNGIVFGSDFKNKKAINDILSNLSFNLSDDNPMQVWKTRWGEAFTKPSVSEEKKALLKKVLNSTPIIKLLSTFIIKIKNPELVPSTPGHDAELNRLMGTVAPLPTRGGPSRSRPNDYGAIPPRARGVVKPNTTFFSTTIKPRYDTSLLKPDYLKKDPRGDASKIASNYLSRFNPHGTVITRTSSGSSASALLPSAGSSASTLLPAAALLPSPSSAIRSLGSTGSTGGGMIGGGISEFSNNKRNVSMIRYFDAIERNYKMIGGNNHAIKIAGQLRQTYSDFLSQLKTNGKKIETADHDIIIRMLDQLEYSEDKLSKVSSYIIRYNELKDDPNFASLLTKNPITIDILKNLEDEYQKMSSRVSSKGIATKNALEQIQKVLASNSLSAYETNSEEFLRGF